MCVLGWGGIYNDGFSELVVKMRIFQEERIGVKGCVKAEEKEKKADAWYLMEMAVPCSRL